MLTCFTGTAVDQGGHVNGWERKGHKSFLANSFQCVMKRIGRKRNLDHQVTAYLIMKIVVKAANNKEVGLKGEG